jgi:triacylglycerol lipase
VVLLHGVVGEPDVALGLRDYFRGIADRLSQAGVAVYSPRLPAAASVAVRARALARAIERIPAERVNIIAHSMGGLDARYAISRLGLKGRVASLITVATPHHGTPLADLGAGILADRLGIAKLLAAVRVDVAAIHDLTTDRAAAFNRQVPDAECVEYGCVVASAVQVIHPLLRPTHSYLHRRAGPNDGLVPVASQRWGTVYAEVEADHWAQIGRSTTFDAPALYERLARELASRGL